MKRNIEHSCTIGAGVAVFAGVLLNSPPAAAQSLPAPVTITTSFPLPAPDAFVTNMRFGPDGLIYAWDGQNVWRQAGVNVDSFGSVPFGTVPSNGSDAGPINFSQDGKTILIGNGAGGSDASGSSSGLLYIMPVSGGTATLAGALQFHQDLIPAPASATMPGAATRFFVDHGTADFSTSGVDLFDFATGNTVPLIQNIPGASSSIAFDSANRLYVGIGFGANRGQIRRFSLPLLDLAATGTLIDWTAGQLMNAADNNAGSGMFFDARRDLFVGGPNGVTVVDPTGAAQLYSTGPSTFPVVFHNATNDQFSLTLNGFSDPMNLGFSPRIYRASDFTVPAPAVVVWTADADGNWSDSSRWNQVAPNGIDQRALLGATITHPLTIMLDSPVTLGVLTMSGPQKYVVSGPNPLTMQVSTTIAAINASGGNHEIAAPIVLASSTDASVANSTDMLTLSGGIGGGGMLSKEGAGTLVITAAITYSGNTAVDGGRLRFEINAGSPTIGTGAIVTVSPGATLELAGSISALGSSGGNRAHVINDSAASGLVVSGSNQIVGAIDGGGSTMINAGGELTADRIIQNALVIDGTADSHSTLTIAASSDGPVGATAASAFGDEPSICGTDRDAASSGNEIGAKANASGVPEPSAIVIALVGSFFTALAHKWCLGATALRLK
jgi:autotransporter-associated beta strand protein